MTVIVVLRDVFLLFDLLCVTIAISIFLSECVFNMFMSMFIVQYKDFNSVDLISKLNFILIENRNQIEHAVCVCVPKVFRLR